MYQIKLLKNQEDFFCLFGIAVSLDDFIQNINNNFIKTLNKEICSLGDLPTGFINKNILKKYTNNMRFKKLSFRIFNNCMIIIGIEAEEIDEFENLFSLRNIIKNQLREIGLDVEHYDISYRVGFR